jgi:hypothetical protein
MKKFTISYLLFVTLVICSFIAMTPDAKAQVLVNRLNVDTTGHPNLTYRHLALTRGNSNSVYVVGNTYKTGEQENFLIVKYTGGTTSWTEEFNTLNDARDFGIDAEAHGSDLYVVGVKSDSLGVDAAIQLISVKQSNGGLNWSTTFSAPNGEVAVPTQVLADNNNVYVAGTMETSTGEYGLLLLKYNTSGVLQWSAVYDSIGMKDGATGMRLRGSTIIVTGASGSSTSSWDIVTVTVSSGGTITGVVRSSNGSGTFSEAVDMAQDANNHTYVLGSASTGGVNLDYKLIKYDSTFNQVWVRTWGDSLPDEPRAMEMDAQGNYVITGYTTLPNGIRAMATVKYHNNGNLLWSNILPGGCALCSAEGLDIHTVLNTTIDTNVYVTGKMFNGTDYDYVTVSYSPSGALRWVKNYDSGIGINDEAQDIVMDDGGTIYVSGTSTSPNDTSYLTVRYEQWERFTSFAVDTDSIALYAYNNLIVKFDTSVLNFSTVNDQGLLYGELGRFIKSDFVDTLEANLNEIFFRNATLVKLAPNFKTTTTFLISNLGDTVKIPPFWNSFLLTFDGGDSTVTYYADSLQKLSKKIRYAHPNYCFQLYSCSTGNCGAVIPNDTYYCNKQFALHDDDVETFENAHVNVEPSWQLETGQSFVKVGIFDSGIEWDHEDFMKRSDLGFQGSKVIGGYNYQLNYSIDVLNTNSPTPSTPLPDEIGHGTKVAGIIGALRNNNKGISGVAGGEWCNDPSENQSGVSLVSLGIVSPASGPSGGGSGTIVLSDAVFAWNDCLIGNTTNTIPNLNITNHSYGVNSSSNSFEEYKSKVYTAYRLGIVTVASRGQIIDKPGNQITYPACFDDDWVISVGGNDYQGEKHDDSYFDYNMDIVAPYGDGNASNNQHFMTDIFNTYSGDLGTSFSAPLATGTAGLLLSYLNNPNGLPDFNNLAPEDIEEIIQRTANPYIYTPYSSEVGWGRLDVGAALQMVNKTTSRLLHFSSSIHNFSETVTKLTGNTDIDLTLTVDAPVQGISALKGTYKAEVWKSTQMINHNITLLPDESIQGFWARSSASDGYPMYTTSLGQNFIDPYEKVYVDQNTLPDENEAEIWSYYYYLKDFITGTPIGWLPRNPHGARMDYTLYLSGGTLSNQSGLSNNQGFSVYPNPTSNSFTVQFEALNASELTIEITSVSGQRISSLSYPVASGSNSIFVDTTEFSSGIYFIKLLNNQLAKTVKLCIQK